MARHLPRLVALCCWAARHSAVGIDVTVAIGPKEQKCFGEHVARTELFVASFEAVDNKSVSVSVSSPRATVFSEHARTKVMTAFTTADAGAHWVCLTNEEETRAEVRLSVTAGPEAKDYSQIAKKEHLDETQVNLRILEDALRNYHSNVIFMRAREERVRRTNDSTAARAVFFCIFNILVMIGVSGWQMLYFKSFFRSKKII